MIRIFLFVDSHKHFSKAVEEYRKRLGKQIEIIELRPVKKGRSEQIILSETQLLKEKLEKVSDYKILLSPSGKNISTEELWTMIEAQKNSGKHIIFIIGGAHGLEYSLLRDFVDFELSLGKMILPHSLAFTVLLEQIYRCIEIEKGSGYHK